MKKYYRKKPYQKRKKVATLKTVKSLITRSQNTHVRTFRSSLTLTGDNVWLYNLSPDNQVFGKCNLKKLSLRMMINHNPATDLDLFSYRVIVFQLKEPSTTSINSTTYTTVAPVLEKFLSFDSASAQTQNTQNYLYLAPHDAYVGKTANVLYDKSYSVPVVINSSNNSPDRFVTLNIKRNKLLPQIKNPDEDDSQLSLNNLYIAVICKNYTAPVTAGPSIVMNGWLSYVQ